MAKKQETETTVRLQLDPVSFQALRAAAKRLSLTPDYMAEFILTMLVGSLPDPALSGAQLPASPSGDVSGGDNECVHVPVALMGRIQSRASVRGVSVARLLCRAITTWRGQLDRIQGVSGSLFPVVV